MVAMTNAANEYVQLCGESSRQPDVFAFLSETNALQPREKLDVILVDQFYRWKNNQAIPVEHYLQRLPEIDHVLAVPLLVEEYGHLEERGIAPSPTEFVQRYVEFGTGAMSLLCEELDVDSSAPQSEAERRTIGRYEVVCLIGKGSFGEVFLGKDPSLNRSVAIKVPSREFLQLGGGADALLSEARVIAKIDHSNIVPVYDFGQTDNGDCYIVSKYVKGKELRSELHKPIPSMEAASVTATLARALHAAHRTGVVHRDVKPANVLLDGHRKPHLLDFGLALQGRRAGTDGAFVGTPAYMSPEQARCESHLVDGRTDIYSLGVMFYEMLAGRRPFQGKGADEHLQHTESAEVQPPRQFVDSIPLELEQVCLKALRHKIADRYATASDFAEAIEQWIEESSSKSVPGPPTEQTQQRIESSARWQSYGRLPEGPSIAVLPFTSMDDNQNAKSLAAGLTEEISTQLSKFKDLFILGRHATRNGNVNDRKLSKLGRELGVEYFLVGSVRRSTEQLRVTARLVENRSSQSLWSETFRGNLSTHDIFEIEDEIANKVTANLGLHDGVIAKTRLRCPEGAVGDIDAYDSVTRFYQYMGAANPLGRQSQIRRELEATVELHPDFPSARAALSSVYLNGFLFNQPEEETRHDLLELAGKAVHKAVAAAPDNSLALEVLFRYEFHCGNHAAFMECVERAIQANPNDTNMLAYAGICLGFLGKLERALPLARKAIALNPNPPGWYHLPEYWNGLLSGDFETAFGFAKRYGEITYWGPTIRAVLLGHMGRIEEAQREWEQVIAMNPNFLEEFEWDMKAWHVNEPLQQTSLAGLAKAGLV